MVAALGDSVTAGVGARANSVLDIFKEYRGVSFSVGGDKTWREYVTLPNILQIFNPNLYGQSYGITRVGSEAYFITKNYDVQYRCAETGLQYKRTLV